LYLPDTQAKSYAVIGKKNLYYNRIKCMKFNINRIRAIVFLVAALGYLPLQSADQNSVKKEVKSEAKVEKAAQKPVAGLSKN